ncbi:SEL1-like repeat protein [Chelativorans intermedius]|uniref:SEL1-like repeat protein n=1 Tax=Chelativorans intermedius TaxID=515947 RepID=A0ABV6DA21_9HYPH|nr:sel1 repeat family protein [Chelativorans intermedius]MCT8999688.1 sel1 repeat family protein [Chelativorans intermedius]
MARLDLQGAGTPCAGGTAQPEMLFQLGMMYATGRDCDMDLVAAHKWLNIAAIKGSERAAQMRAELAGAMSKAEIARALREAREWMTQH